MLYTFPLCKKRHDADKSDKFIICCGKLAYGVTVCIIFVDNMLDNALDFKKIFSAGRPAWFRYSSFMFPSHSENVVKQLIAAVYGKGGDDYFK